MGVSISLEGKVALVTGASRGIGEAIARLFAEAGATVILASRKLEGLEEVASSIEKSGGRAVPMACNTGDLEQITGVMRAIRVRFEGLDILVNNAAANPYFGPMEEAPEWAWDKICAVNLKGPFFLMQQAAMLMKERGGGSIVNVSSVNAVRPALFQGIYSMTKAGLVALTQGYAKELAAHNIRVNALLPGLTDTQFSSAITADEGLRDHVVQQIPAGRIAEPSEMAGAALYLVSDAASYVTGSSMTVDGGMLA